MIKGRLPSHHCHIAVGLLTPHSLKKSFKFVADFLNFVQNIFDTVFGDCAATNFCKFFLLLYSRQLIKKNNNSKTSRFKNHAMQNLPQKNYSKSTCYWKKLLEQSTQLKLFRYFTPLKRCSGKWFEKN